MPISTKCTHCKAIFRVPDELAGKKVKCQKCASPFTVVKMDETPPTVAAAPEQKKTTKASEPAKTKAVAKSPTAVSAKEPKRPTKVDKKTNPDDGLDFNTPSRTPPTKAKSGGGCMLFVMLFFIGGGVLGCLGCAGGIAGWQMGWFGDGIVIQDAKPADKVVVIKDFKDVKDLAKDNPFKDLAKDNPLKDLAKDNPFKDLGKDDPFKDVIKIDGTKDLLKDKTLDDKKDVIKDKDFPKFDDKKDDTFKEKDRPPIDLKKDNIVKDKDRPLDGGKLPKLPLMRQIILKADGTGRILGEISTLNRLDKDEARHTAHEIVFEAGSTYQIESKSQFFFPDLVIRDDKGQEIARGKEVDKFSSRVDFQSTRTARYHIETWSYESRGKSTGSFHITVRRTEAGVVNPPDKKPPEKVETGDISHRTLSFKNPTKLIGDMVWARDGKSFFLMNTDGQIARFDAATGDILKQHDFARKCNNLAMCGEGLLISARDAQEVWLVDPDDLGSVLRRIPVSALTRVTAGVDSSIAVAGSGGGFGKTGLNVLDLKKGTVVEFYKGFAINHLIASPDGKYVFAEESEHLKRYRLTDMILKFEEESYRLGSANSICVSPCSTYVAMPSGGGNGKDHPDHPQVENGYSTFVYPAWNLKRPALTVGSGAYPRALGFDTKLGYVIAQNHDNPFLLFSFGGISRGGTKITGLDGGGPGTELHEFAVSPKGGEVLIRVDTKVVHVTLKMKGEPIAKLDPPPDPKVDPKIDPKVDPKVDPKKDPPMTKDPPKLVQTIESKDVSYKVIPFKTDGPVKHPVWANDGKSFYVALMNGNLLRINAETQAVEKTHALNKRLDLEASLSMSAEGLVLASPNERQILVIDPDDLSVIKKKISADFARFSVGRDSKYGIASMNAKTSVRFVDLEKPELSAPITFKLPTHSMRMSADGSNVFFTDAGKIIRYSADGQRLNFEEQSAAYVFAPGSLHLSPDGGMLSLAGDPAAPPADNPVRGLRILPFDSVKKPTLVIPKFDTPRAVGLDTRGGWFFVADTKKPLTIFNLSGVKQVEVAMPEVDMKTVLEINPSPTGQQVLFKTPTSVVQVKLNLPAIDMVAKMDPKTDPKVVPDPKKKFPPGGIPVNFLTDGSYRNDNFLVDQDTKNHSGKRHKWYLARLEAGVTYQIDMIVPKTVFDAYLYLIDDDEKVIAQDDDGGGGRNARIIHTPGRTAFYRIDATSLFGNSNGPYTLTIRRIGGAPKIGKFDPPKFDKIDPPKIGKVDPPLPDPNIPLDKNTEPRVVGQVALVNPTMSNGFVTRELPEYSTDLCWDAQGKLFYAITKNGEEIIKISRTGELLASAKLPQKCERLVLTAEGLVTIPISLGGIWVLDTNKLAVVQKFTLLKGAHKVLGTPDSSTLVVLSMFAGKIDQLDMKTRKYTDTPNGIPPYGGQSEAVMTSDAKYLLYVGQKRTLERLRVESGKFTHLGTVEEKGKLANISLAVNPNNHEFAVSYVINSKSKDANTSIPIEVYSHLQWDKPAYTISDQLVQMAFDGDGRFYGVRSRSHEYVCYPQPKTQPKNAVVLMPSKRGSAPLVLASPQGGGCLFAGTDKVYLIEPVNK